MKKEQKSALIEELKEIVEGHSNFYLADIDGLNAQETSDLRRKCFDKDIKLKLVKNTLFKIALEQAEGNYDELYDVIKYNTSVMFCNTANAPGKLIKELNKSGEKPKLKAACIDGGFYIGEEHLDALANLKSKEELVADVILLLQSPMKTVLGQLESGKNTLSGVIKTLSERE